MPVRLPAPVRSRSVPLAAGGLAIALLLAGCSNPAPLQPTKPEASAGADGGQADGGGGSGGGSTASPTPAPPTGTPVSITCDDLLPALTAFSPGSAVSSLPADASDDGIRADVLDMQGLACGFLSTDGTAVEVDVAQPVAAELRTRRDAAILQTDPVAGYPQGIEAYFELQGDTGVSTIYSAEHMVVMRSASFYEPGDHVDLGNAVLAVVGS